VLPPRRARGLPRRVRRAGRFTCLPVRTVLLVAIALCAACRISAAEERARRETLAADGRALELAADAVEARILAGETRLAVWHELAARHQQISEVACRIGDAHFQDMARLLGEREGLGIRRPGLALAGSERLLARGNEQRP